MPRRERIRGRWHAGSVEILDTRLSSIREVGKENFPMASVLAFLKAFEPLLVAGFDQTLIPELEQLAAGAKSPDVQVVLQALVMALKAVGDAELPKV